MRTVGEAIATLSKDSTRLSKKNDALLSALTELYAGLNNVLNLGLEDPPSRRLAEKTRELLSIAVQGVSTLQADLAAARTEVQAAKQAEDAASTLVTTFQRELAASVGDPVGDLPATVAQPTEQAVALARELATLLGEARAKVERLQKEKETRAAAEDQRVRSAVQAELRRLKAQKDSEERAAQQARAAALEELRAARAKAAELGAVEGGASAGEGLGKVTARIAVLEQRLATEAGKTQEIVDTVKVHEDYFAKSSWGTLPAAAVLYVLVNQMGDVSTDVRLLEGLLARAAEGPDASMDWPRLLNTLTTSLAHAFHQKGTVTLPRIACSDSQPSPAAGAGASSSGGSPRGTPVLPPRAAGVGSPQAPLGSAQGPSGVSQPRPAQTPPGAALSQQTASPQQQQQSQLPQQASLSGGGLAIPEGKHWAKRYT